MGIFDKVKSLKNAITGGGAKVSIEVVPGKIGEPFAVTVNAVVGDDELKINAARLQIEGTETVEVLASDAELETSEEERALEEGLITAKHTTFSLDMEVAGEQTLQAGQSYSWTVSATIPEDVQPPFKGKFCKHSFIICASLDCFGNDPDSGWLDLEVTS